MVRNKTAIVDCDDVCKEMKEQQKKLLEAERAQKMQEEMQKQQKELEKYQKMFEGKKRSRKRVVEEKEELGFLQKYKVVLTSALLLCVSLGVYYVFFWVGRWSGLTLM